GIGQAMYIYAQDGDKFPVASGTSENSAATYWACRESLPPTNSGAAPSVTADLWMLVRDNNSTPRQFTCPHSSDVPDPAQDTLAYYDFASGVNLSYAYQYMHGPVFPLLGTNDDPTLPLAADANPYIKGGITIDPRTDRDANHTGNSTNHFNR